MDKKEVAFIIAGIELGNVKDIRFLRHHYGSAQEGDGLYGTVLRNPPGGGRAGRFVHQGTGRSQGPEGGRPDRHYRTD